MRIIKSKVTDCKSATSGAFPRAVGNSAKINEQGEEVLKGILTNSEMIMSTRHHARFGNIIEYKIPGGQGVRFGADEGNFIGFIEP